MPEWLSSSGPSRTPDFAFAIAVQPRHVRGRSAQHFGDQELYLAAQAFSEAAARLLTQEDLWFRASTVPSTGPSAVSRVDGLRPGSHFLPVLGCFAPRDSAGRYRECNRERDRDHRQCNGLCHFIPPFMAGDVIARSTLRAR